MYDKEYYKGWYEKNKQKARDYYQKNKAHILQVHQAWAKKNVDTGGSVWRKYNKRKRIKDPFLDAKYYDSHREQILAKKRELYQQRNFPYRMDRGI